MATNESKREPVEPELVIKTPVGDFISPVEFMVRVLGVIAESPEGVAAEELEQKVIHASPEITAHPTLNVEAAWVDGAVLDLQRLGYDVYTDKMTGNIRYFDDKLF